MSQPDQIQHLEGVIAAMDDQIEQQKKIMGQQAERLSLIRQHLETGQRQAAAKLAAGRLPPIKYGRWLGIQDFAAGCLGVLDQWPSQPSPHDRQPGPYRQAAAYTLSGLVSLVERVIK